MGRLLLVCVGGALGSGARYLISVVAIRWLGAEFPFGTLAVNLVGSFLIGLIQQLAFGAAIIPEDTRLFLTTGVMGGLTTYSAFSYETARLVQVGAWTEASLNVAITVVGCLLLCFAGMALGRALAPLRG
jgi:fluoride exporter